MRSYWPAAALLGSSLLVACGGRPPPAETAASAGAAAPVPVPEASAPHAMAAPTDPAVADAVRTALGADTESRYFDARVDLNGDGLDEIVTYVAGPVVCGTGGCPIFVFTPRDGALVQVGDIAVAHPPVLLAASSTNGWRDLIVRIAGGGIPGGDALLRFDGARYPDNPTVPPAEQVASTEGATLLIGDFESYTDGKALQGGQSQ